SGFDLMMKSSYMKEPSVKRDSSSMTKEATMSIQTREEVLQVAEPTAIHSNRLDRRKARTRTALIRAAQSFIAAGNLNVPIGEITQAADVGLGSFYNHFESREDLFEAAVEDVLELLGGFLDE